MSDIKGEERRDETAEWYKRVKDLHFVRVVASAYKRRWREREAKGDGGRGGEGGGLEFMKESCLERKGK